MKNEKLERILYLKAEVEYWDEVRKSTYSDSQIERAFFKLDTLPEKIESLESKLTVSEKEELRILEKLGGLIING